MSQLYYAGIGARKTPKKYAPIMKKLASFLESKGFILRSGGADGADSFFESGVKNISNKEIYTPWKNFNKNDSELYTIPKWAFELCEEIYSKYELERIDSGKMPEWKRIKNSIKRLYARNMLQIFGQDFEDISKHSKFVICWTENGLAVGGTRIAIWGAEEYDIPIINMYDNDSKEQFNDLIKQYI